MPGKVSLFIRPKNKIRGVKLYMWGKVPCLKKVIFMNFYQPHTPASYGSGLCSLSAAQHFHLSSFCKSSRMLSNNRLYLSACIISWFRSESADASARVTGSTAAFEHDHKHSTLSRKLLLYNRRGRPEIGVYYTTC